MGYRKHGLRSLGLCVVAALGLMAFGAAGAQANGDWRVEGQTTTGTIGVTAQEKENDFLLLSSFGKNNVSIEILCTKLVIDDGLLFVGGGSSAELLFSECKTFLEKSTTASKSCVAKEPIVAKVKDLLIKHEGSTYDLFSPAEGTTFTTIELGALCAAGEKVPVTGNLVAECVTVACTAESVKHPIIQAPAALFPSDKLSFGTHEASLDGVATLQLTEPNASAKWSSEAL